MKPLRFPSTQYSARVNKNNKRYTLAVHRLTDSDTASSALAEFLDLDLNFKTVYLD
jgi:hypothetical protein